ncbi:MULTISPECIES: beta-ketoacyl synthase N-terminal-like domain-containing protein [Paenibacillus]|uniref:beta-ketoacyl synthase N-terminal-like domain-containing protein n=1 Tax=Paenibacillus TaxID=44249 RepID=UPI0022B92743|nr:beta-ketoacyl synthase N-terminal-like domain-containing protein [Paenibacillus caseinilyticus]MCZ8522702.1 beta-ketoacyl synthase N-terminal-like domain-containing protein [Paenibacillus caseinilyticus]
MELKGSENETQGAAARQEVAIVGMACRFPGAEDYEEYWKLLVSGRSSVDEIPPERWDWSAYWGDKHGEGNTSYSKWGGFLKDVDAFDPGFFGLSAREAETMDPQQRIMLELAWNALEDAGIVPSRLSGTSVGVFTSAFNYDYKELQEQPSRIIQTYHSTGTASTVIANRISHFLNFKGPSVTIDTACSGSMNAIHAAVQSLQTGECRVALAGGVNLLLTPTRHISFAKTGMLSPTGSCKTFDDSADGYVRSEGAGILVLKPLSLALEDGDRIYGIVKGSAINHSGKTHTLTYPNPEAQAEVICEAYRRAGVSPASVSYIEAHGTGTPKGDPLEFQGLCLAFGQLAAEEGAELGSGYCALGSVKSNIGHLEAAAGIAGVVKTLLAFKHRQLPKIHHFQRLNHRIKLEDTPFYILNDTVAWEKSHDAQGRPLPRRAGVSSFGFGGTNAHLLLEEAPAALELAERKSPYHLICLSAKTEEALRERMKALRAWIGIYGEQHNLHDLCATLLAAREQFNVRSAFVVSSLQDLSNKLSGVLEGKEPEDSYFGVTNTDQTVSVSPADKVRAVLFRRAGSNRAHKSRLAGLAERYAGGECWDMPEIFKGTAYQRLALPGYPFARERYWLTQPEQPMPADRKGIDGAPGQADVLHPLLHRNTSTLQEHRYTSVWCGQEKGFLVEGSSYPGVKAWPMQLLEMARTALALSDTDTNRPACLKLQDIIWPEPITECEGGQEVHTALVPLPGGTVGFEIYREAGPAPSGIIYCQGKGHWEAAEAGAAAVQLPDSGWTAAALPEHLPYVKEVHTDGTRYALRLQLAASSTEEPASWTLDPAMLEAAVESALWCDDAAGRRTARHAHPVSLTELKLFTPSGGEVWLLVQAQRRKSGEGTLSSDLLFCDMNGNVRAAIKGLELRLLPAVSKQEADGLEESRALRCLQKGWKPHPLTSKKPFSGTIAVLAGPGTEDIGSELKRTLEAHRVEVLTEPSLLRGAQYGAWIDITGCGSETEHSWEWIKALQEAVAHGRDKGLVVLGVTKGLELLENESVLRTGADRAGLYRMLQSEYRQLVSRHIDVEASASAGEIAAIIADELESDAQEYEVCYRKGCRYEAELQEIGLPQPAGSRASSLDFTDQDALWITGGTRGIGFLCAKHYVERHGVKRLVLCGREELPPRELWDEAAGSSSRDKIDRIVQLEELGAEVKVLSTPLSDREAMTEQVRRIRSEWGPAAGVIHCAGSWDLDNPAFISKPLDTIKQVLEPKTAGVDVLLDCFKEEQLRFFVLFSSVSAIIPTLSAGRSDYAMANAYMDYAAAANQGSLPVVSVQWPSWKETGLGEVKNKAYDDTGLLSITNQEGLQWLDRIITSGIGPVVMPAVVRPENWEPARLLERSAAAPRKDEVSIPSAPDKALPSPNINDEITERTEVWLTGLLAEELKTEPAKLGRDMRFGDFGMDSIMLAQVVRKMDRTLKTVSVDPAAFIEHGTIAGLAGYLAESHPEALSRLLYPQQAAEEEGDPSLQSVEKRDLTSAEDAAPHGSGSDGTTSPAGRPVNSIRRQPANKGAESRKKVAVIGMACHFPGAQTLESYWNNLRSGTDCMGEVPLSRWDWRRYYEPGQHKEGRSISKWGAFLEQIEYFDPAYFHIAPTLAEQIDPLQRQWLEVSAEALADAGFGKQDLWGKRVGVFAGTRTSNFGSKYCGTTKDVLVATGQNFITAHLSHIYNFKGPNMVVDAACASSLTAIHLGVRAIQSGEAEVALAGGVEILLDETMYLDLSAAKILSPEGRCRTFDSSANGIGLGEGCGVLVLKSLDAAIADGDKIYGVIDGTAVNNDGNTMGVTTPNPEAQRELIEAAIEDGGVHPETITYVEAHGTGTLIGDPIELKALTQVFGRFTSKKQFCGVGSVKTNLGHLLSAAGAASIIKVLLSMTNGELPPTLNCSEPNPRFHFGESPFFIVRETLPWQGERNVLRAGISSFGLGGNNAHLIVSNEGIPHELRANMTPKGGKVVFNRQRYWPKPPVSEQPLQTSLEAETEDAFAGFFEPVRLTR